MRKPSAIAQAHGHSLNTVEESGINGCGEIRDNDGSGVLAPHIGSGLAGAAGAWISNQQNGP
jgi:hypothetical protein